MNNARWLGWALVALVACGAEESPNPGPSGAGGSPAGGAGASSVSGTGAGGSGGDPIGPRFQDLAAAVEAERVALGASGVALAIIEDGEVTFARGFGSKSAAGDAGVDPTTLFRIGSVTKMLTATALLQHVAHGEVDLSDPVTSAVPEFHFASDATWAPSITLAHLLTHTSGMYDYLTVDAPAYQKKDSALASYLLTTFGQIDFLMVPAGTFYNYSNPNFYLAGLVTERASGALYRDRMKDKVFDPLDMKRTFFLASEVKDDGDYAVGATSYPDVPPVVEPDTYDNAWARPAGYAWSNALDLAKFITFLMEGNDAVLPAAQREAMQSAQIDTREFLDLVHYGYGLFVSNGAFLGSVDDFYAMKFVQHGGDIPGFAADVFFVPELRFGMVALSNADGAHFIESWTTALRTLAPLPAPATPPVLEVDPSTFGKYEGVYNEPFLGVGDISVAVEGDDLTVDIPGLASAGISYDPILAPVVGDSFELVLDGAPFLVTFMPDANDASRYFRTRVFVGIKGAQAGPPPPPAPGRGLADRLRRAARERPWQFRAPAR
jgi:CubicO group peptidase (beta-lactamase class C family)